MMLHRSVLQQLDAELRRAPRSGRHRVRRADHAVQRAGSARSACPHLADRVLLSPAGTTHLVTRLERDRLVRREVDPADRPQMVHRAHRRRRSRTASRPTHPQRRPATNPLRRHVTRRTPNPAPHLATPLETTTTTADLRRMNGHALVRPEVAAVLVDDLQQMIRLAGGRGAESVVVIGAGVSGLVAARALQRAGVPVTGAGRA